ncbi:hypothetical protein XENTR_v10017654 [Xenopus tropicalis]|nr:hypothetical protein XENTR_v10017654 [Xenopus tropicalis]
MLLPIVTQRLLGVVGINAISPCNISLPGQIISTAGTPLWGAGSGALKLGTDCTRTWSGWRGNSGAYCSRRTTWRIYGTCLSSLGSEGSGPRRHESQSDSPRVPLFIPCSTLTGSLGRYRSDCTFAPQTVYNPLCVFVPLAQDLYIFICAT